MTSKPIIACMGNCQGGVIRGFLLTVPEISRDYEVVLTRTPQEFEAVRPRVRAFVQQVTHNWDDFRFDPADLPPDAVLIRCPAALMNYPWPLIPFQKRSADRGPRNAMFPYTICDDLVMRLVEEGVSKADLLDAYFAVDVTRRFPLDRLKALNEAKTRQIEAMSDFGVWDFAESAGQAFRTANHPNGPLLAYMLEQVVERLPLEDMAHAVKLARARASGYGIQSVEAPVHPQVADHFGLAWAKDKRWNFWVEGDFTFEQHILRLYDYSYNEALHAGREALKRREDALPFLAQAVEELPDSEGAMETYSSALIRAARYEEAVAALRRLFELAPSPKNASALVSILRRTGQADEAERFLDDLGPIAEHPSLLVVRSRGLRLRDPARADELLARAAALDPDDLQVLVEQAGRLEAEGRLADALTIRERAHYVSNWSVSTGNTLEALRVRVAAADGGRA